MRDLRPDQKLRFEAGDRIEGTIGLDPATVASAPAAPWAAADADERSRAQAREPVHFAGVVVRVETRGTLPVYAVKINRISDGGDGRKWITRPDL